MVFSAFNVTPYIFSLCDRIVLAFTDRMWYT